MMKGHSVAASKPDGQPRNNVEKKLLKVIDRTHRAIEEAKAILKSIDEEQPATAASAK